MQDQLLFFDNSVVAFNKSSSKAYYYINNMVNGLPNVGSAGAAATTDHGNDLIPTGSALIIRKAISTGFTAFWQNTPTY